MSYLSAVVADNSAGLCGPRVNDTIYTVGLPRVQSAFGMVNNLLTVRRDPHRSDVNQRRGSPCPGRSAISGRRRIRTGYCIGCVIAQNIPSDHRHPIRLAADWQSNVANALTQGLGYTEANKTVTCGVQRRCLACKLDARRYLLRDCTFATDLEGPLSRRRLTR
jgi:hypothetical protein